MNYPNRYIKKGESNTEIVIAIQKKLNALGIVTILENGIFDDSTKSAVKLFQSLAADSQGNPLVSDGIVGSITWEALFGKKIQDNPESFSTNYSFLNKVIEVANSQIGVLEQPLGSNSGPEVEKYLASVGLPKGNPWCMAFVYYCFNEASKSLLIKNPLVKTGGCLHHWNSTTIKKIMASQAKNNPSLIVPGSIFIMDHGSGLGHTGIVTNVAGGFVTTIEGNTNYTNSREGIGVFLVTNRKINSINKGFIVY
jgi:hypothetical protein